MMTAAGLLSTLKRRVPEFVSDDLFLDLPYVVFGEFATFVIERLRQYGNDDPVVKRSFGLINDMFVDDDREMVNIIETTLFEQLADDTALVRSVQRLLEASARTSLQHIAKGGGGSERGHQ
jgi:hypothetical protein